MYVCMCVYVYIYIYITSAPGIPYTRRGMFSDAAGTRPSTSFRCIRAQSDIFDMLDLFDSAMLKGGCSSGCGRASERGCGWLTKRLRDERRTQRASAADGRRRRCKYAEECYQKSSEHALQFCHPGDREWSGGEQASGADARRVSQGGNAA